MKKSLTSLLLALFSTIIIYGQRTLIRGVVVESITKEPVPSATVRVKGTGTAVATSDDGRFSIETNTPLPVTLTVSSIGFITTDVTVSEGVESLQIELVRTETFGQEVVIAATRVPMQLLQSPVSIEKLNLAKIKSSPSTSYYDAIISLKGVDATTSSLTYKTLSTRGFNLSGSPRVNQIMDGMDNQAPGLNFAIGNFVGLSDLDVESIELLPGASSVLYGPGGMNGTILINSKSPFIHKGFSAMVRQGMLHTNKKFRNEVAGLTDVSFRLAGVLKDKLGYKFTLQHVRAIDWVANDTTNYQRSGNFGKVKPGNRQTDPNYDGINVYGDETSVDLRNFLSFYLPPNHPLMASPVMVSRTGYLETDLVDPETKNFKLTGALHYRITDKLEARLIANYAKGQTVYTGSNRFVFTDVKLAQYKIELRHKNWFVNAFTTQSDAGNTYSATTTMQIFNEAWKRSFDQANIAGSWYPQYTGAFLTALNGGMSVQNAHQAARTFADAGRPAPGTGLFNQIFDQVRKIPIPNGGLFIDKSDLWFGEAQYQFTDKIAFADVVIGANYKKSFLDTKGTIFIDTMDKLDVGQWGAFIQATKKVWEEKLSLSVAGRYDKNENFDGRFTPRFSAVYTLAKNHHIRASYQTAYRFPTNTDLFLRLNIGTGVYLLGGLPWINDYMKSAQYPVYKIKSDGTPESSTYQYRPMKPETSQSYEIGYKGVLQNKLLLDFYFYLASYENFLGRNILYQPATGRSYSIVTNSDVEVRSYGWGTSMDYMMTKQYTFRFAFYSDVITKIPTTFIGGFNTPKYRATVGLSGSEIGKDKRIGFNVHFRWQDSFLYERDFATGMVDAFATLDAQVSYQIPKIKSQFRIGGTNITNHYYQDAFGNPMIGGLYYISYVFNY